MDHPVDRPDDAFCTPDGFPFLAAMEDIGVHNLGARQEAVPAAASHNNRGDGGSVTGPRQFLAFQVERSMFDLYALKGGMLLIEHVVHDSDTQPLGAFCQFVAARGVYPLSIFAL